MLIFQLEKGNSTEWISEIDQKLSSIQINENTQNDIVGRLKTQVDNMLTEAMASAALATASMGNNQTNGESILRVELRKLRDLFAKDSQRIHNPSPA